MRKIESDRISQWKTLAIIFTMIGYVASLSLALPFLGAASNWVEAQLLGGAHSTSAPVSWLAISGYYLWEAAKRLAMPAGVLVMSYFVERYLGETDREPKNYALAALVQATFLIFALLMTDLLYSFIPSSQFLLFDLGIGWGFIESTLASIGTVVIFVLTLDILQYWSHRLHHRIPILWKFHKVHHSPRDLDALHNFTHPVEHFVRFFIILLPLSLVIRLDHFQIFLVFTVIAVQNQLTHMNIPMNIGMFRSIFVDNKHHFIHHSREPRHYDRNFSFIFSFVDRIFGTYEPAEGDTLPKTGLDATSRPLTLRDYMLAR